MAKSRQQKQEILQKLVDLIKNSKSAVFVNFEGLTVADIQDFRKSCRAENLEYMVAKKTLLNKAMEDNNLSEVDLSSINTGIGSVFGLHDEVAPAQVVAKFIKGHEVMNILGGIMLGNPEGERFLDESSVQALSKLPSKQALLGQLVGTLQAPISGFANVLVGNIRGLVTALNAIKDQKV